MKSRINILTERKPAFAGTFHSFCARILRIDGQNLGIPSDFSIYDEEDSRDLIKTIVENKNFSTELVLQRMYGLIMILIIE